MRRLAQEARREELRRGLVVERARQAQEAEESSQVAEVSRHIVTQMDLEKTRMQQLRTVLQRHQEVRQGRIRSFLQEIDRGLSWLADHSNSVQMAKTRKEHA